MNIIIGFVVVIFLYILIVFNKFILQKNKVKQAKSTIDVYLKQRFDLIPNLVEVVKAYSKYEEKLFLEISEQRKLYLSQEEKSLEDASKLNNNFNKILGIVENYPELKASEQFLNLQRNLSKIESQLQAARRIYNVEVTKYNIRNNVFPSEYICKII